MVNPQLLSGPLLDRRFSCVRRCSSTLSRSLNNSPVSNSRKKKQPRSDVKNVEGSRWKKVDGPNARTKPAGAQTLETEVVRLSPKFLKSYNFACWGSFASQESAFFASVTFLESENPPKPNFKNTGPANGPRDLKQIVNTVIMILWIVCLSRRRNMFASHLRKLSLHHRGK